jgi:hypothetical protein
MAALRIEPFLGLFDFVALIGFLGGWGAQAGHLARVEGCFIPLNAPC